MRRNKIRAHCLRCRHQQLFVRAVLNHPLHLLLTLLTLGLWSVSWVALCIGRLLRPWRCEHCGWHNPIFKLKTPEPQPARIGRLQHAVAPGH